MLVGLQEEGELCGMTAFDECADGFACRYGNGYSSEGICGAIAVAGERCTHDDDCDSWDTELFCNRTSGECQERGDLGDDCAYVDPTFGGTNGDLYPGFDEDWHQHRAAIAIECKRGLWCDPVALECVAFCSDGALCNPNAGNWDCPEGLTCNITETPRLFTNPYIQDFGVCRAAVADDGPCTVGSECTSNRCNLGADGYICFPALKADGAACTVTTAGVGELDSECESGFCAADSTTTTDGKCATRCSEQGECPDTHFCDNDLYVDETADPFPCDLKRANDAACDTDYDLSDPQGAGTNFMCASGFCDTTVPATPTCEPKVAAGGACATGQDSACPATQFCNTALCTDFRAIDADCAGDSYSCGPGNYCWYDAANTVYDCKAYGGVGDNCAAGLQCDWYTEGLLCAVIGALNQCHAPGAFPTGATCNGAYYDLEGTYYSLDSVCADSWCMNNLTCAVPIAAGEACTTNSLASRCEAGYFCKNDVDANTPAGECTVQVTVGQPCDPRFGNANCLNNATCELRNDTFVCASWAIPPETLYCDGT